MRHNFLSLELQNEQLLLQNKIRTILSSAHYHYTTAHLAPLKMYILSLHAMVEVASQKESLKEYKFLRDCYLIVVFLIDCKPVDKQKANEFF